MLNVSQWKNDETISRYDYKERVEDFIVKKNDVNKDRKTKAGDSSNLVILSFCLQV